MLTSNQVSIFFLSFPLHLFLSTHIADPHATHPHANTSTCRQLPSMFISKFFFCLFLLCYAHPSTDPCPHATHLHAHVHHPNAEFIFSKFSFFCLFFLFAFFFSSQSSASVHQHVCTQRIQMLTPSDCLQGRCFFCLFFILIFVHQLCICTHMQCVHFHMLCPPPFPSVSSFFFVFVYTNLCLHTTHLMHTQGVCVYTPKSYLSMFLFFSFFFFTLIGVRMQCIRTPRPPSAQCICSFLFFSLYSSVLAHIHTHYPSIGVCMVALTCVSNRICFYFSSSALTPLCLHAVPLQAKAMHVVYYIVTSHNICIYLPNE